MAGKTGNMEFNELIADFAARHGVDDLIAADNAAAEMAEAERPAFGSSDFVQV